MQRGRVGRLFRAESRCVGDFCFLLLRTRSRSGETLNREKTDSYLVMVDATARVRGQPPLSARTEVYLFIYLFHSAHVITVVRVVLDRCEGLLLLFFQGSYRSGKTGKCQRIFLSGKVWEMSGKYIIIDKSGKMILDHADCRWLLFFASSNIKNQENLWLLLNV